MYVCKECGKPVEQSIEGELICSDCWTLSQMSTEDRAFEKSVAWFDTHCAVCEKVTPQRTLERTGGFCNECAE